MKNYLKELYVFLDYLKDAGYSESTLNGYWFGLKDFFNYLSKNKIEITKFKNHDILNFKNTLVNKSSPQTINSKIYAIKKYVQYLKQERNVKINFDVDIIKVKSKKDLIPVKDINKLLSYINGINKNPVISQRDKLIIKMLYFTGLKTKELLKIKKGDIRNNILEIENKKITLDNKLLNDINSYIKKAKINNSGFIFFNYSPATNSTRRKLEANKPLTEKAVQDIFNRYKSIIDDKLSIIDLRNSYAGNLKRRHTELKFDKINNHTIINTKDDFLKIR